MPNKKYKPEHKAYALRCIAQNKGNVVLTAIQTGIPERTLRAWQHKARLITELNRRTVPYEPPVENAAAVSPQEMPPTPTPHMPPPEFTDNLAAMEFMRSQILDGLLSSDDWSNSLAFMSPYQRSQIAIMLLDRLMKLDEHLKPYRPKPPTIVKVNDSEGEEPNGRKRDFAESPSRTEENSKL